MVNQNPKLNFEILIDEIFLKINTETNLKHIENKYVLSIINDFEDGKWRYLNFKNFIWNNIPEAALSLKERNSLVNQHHSILVAAAKKLRLTDKEKKEIGKGSELAEIFLYGIMKNHYNAIPVVPKIFYKQNNQDYAKGADSVHIVMEGNNDFSLWFGEAKFYNSIEDSRFPVVIKSVENSLHTDKLQKENSIITNLSDLNDYITDAELKEKIIMTLSTDKSIDELKPKLHIPILLLHECSITKDCRELTIEYKKNIKQYHTERAIAYFKKQIELLSEKIFKYNEIKFHIILFPVPDKTVITNDFINNVEFYKNQ